MRAAEEVVLSYLWNSLWMAPLFWMAGEVASWVLGRRREMAVHRVWVGCLLMEAGFPAVSGMGWRWMGWTHGVGGAGRVSVRMGPAVVVAGGVRLPEVVAVWVVVGYAVVVAWMLLRFGWGVWQAGRLGREWVTAELKEDEALVWEGVRARFGCERAVLLESAGVRTPLTVGVWRKRVILPAGLRAELGAGELLAVLAHECAHVQREDFGMNLLYAVLALPVAYHPLVWRTRGRLAESREWVCDGMAAEAVGAGRVYARMLVRLAALLVGERLDETKDAIGYAMGVFDANTLERRVMRLTEGVTVEGVWRRGAKVAFCVALAAGTCASAWGWRSAVVVGAGSQGAPLQVKGGVMAGQVESRVPPVYPPEAKAAGIEGSVVMRATISKEGKVEALRVESGPEELQAAALESVRQWVYKPYLLNGEPVAVETVITVNFQLQ